MLEHVLSAAQMPAAYGEAMLSGLTDAQWTQTPAGLECHPASILAHIATIECLTASTLDGQAPDIPGEWMPLYAESTQAKPGAAYPSPKDLLAAWRSGRARITAALQKATPADMAQPPAHEAIRKFIPTNGGLMVLSLTVHESTHFGQLSAWRRAMGLELPI